jgi:hypothetical protein
MPLDRRIYWSLTSWTTAVGGILWLLGVRRLGIGLIRVAGLGGVGMIYGHFAATHHLRVEPVPIFMGLARRPLDWDYLRSLGFHMGIWLLAELMERKR